MSGYPIELQTLSGLTEIPIVANTWLDISKYVGKLFQFTATIHNGTNVEFSNDGVNPIPHIQPMRLVPSSMVGSESGGNEWSTNYPAKYVRIPSLAAFTGGIKLYGSLSPIERKNHTIVTETGVVGLTGAITTIFATDDLDPFVQRTVIDADTNGVLSLIQVEVDGRLTPPAYYVNHNAATLLGESGVMRLPGVAGAADNAVIMAPTVRVNRSFNRLTVFCTAGTVDVEIREWIIGAWKTATLRRQSDNVLVSQLSAGEVGILENVAYEYLQVLQKGATASNADLLFSEPFVQPVSQIDLGAYSGPIAMWSHSPTNGASFYIHKFY